MIPIPEVKMCRDKDGYWVCHQRVPGARRGRQVRVHRWILSMKIGRPLERHEHAHHTCHDTCPDSRGCLNSDHLEVKTAAEHNSLHKTGYKPSEATRAKMVVISRGLWSDPEYREKQMEMMRRPWSPARLAACAERMRKRWEDPAYREAQTAQSRAAAEHRSQEMTRLWKEPDFRGRRVAAFRSRNYGPKRRAAV